MINKAEVAQKRSPHVCASTTTENYGLGASIGASWQRQCHKVP
jgi:hypothetical protein